MAGSMGLQLANNHLPLPPKLSYHSPENTVSEACQGPAPQLAWFRFFVIDLEERLKDTPI